ncbi:MULTISPECIES: DUF92 domain-containing protein [unclassified Bacillus (in: firmicutes)]|uniref:DUF92 domain-containing protein n=1 Tax=unclassified Bacillus (in: firmicutes) TaxID=185979 RepID=UPI0008E277A4|nr:MULTISPECIES: DUF92 domain-containing protein [unclassified Bacillus (in: firmicutes)]SFA96197.1 TIGR00297 family protein [Bacillus sp. UNCCL13]SFQ79658.1 TIGR00297 family protein [Bacillus sp. cl95]
MIIDAIVVFSILIISFLGYLTHSLTISGSISAIIVGSCVYIGFGVPGLILLGTFFATSTFWSKYKSAKKKSIEEKLEKDGKRDWQQVAANGGAAAAISLIQFINPNNVWLVLFCIAIASANSDTWASEIGSLSRKKPIFIKNLKRVEKGTSGAISLLGTSSAVMGSFLIAIVGKWVFNLHSTKDLWIVFVFGFLGNMIDTIIGAYFQQTYQCTVCGIETEKKSHCGKRNVRLSGYLIIDNDFVNFLSGLLSMLLAYISLISFL